MVVGIGLTVVKAVNVLRFQWEAIAYSIFIVDGWEFWEADRGALGRGRFLRWRGNRVGLGEVCQGADGR